jgi:hypothetical protein
LSSRFWLFGFAAVFRFLCALSRAVPRLPPLRRPQGMISVVTRLLAHMPPTQLNFRVVLIDMPVVNSFSSAGGCIYVTRKMVDMLGAGFVFLSPDRIIARSSFDPKNSALMDFPSGKVIERLPIGRQSIETPAHGDYVILRPVKNARVGLMD